MPLIEELPITQTHRVTHGWAYVPDTGPTSIAAVQPGNRKRGRDGATAAATATATAKQQKAVQSRLDSLDRENYRDGVSIPIPARAGAEKKRDKKMTPNVRRILTYQRAFAHYLADEEANLQAGTGATVQSQGQNVNAKQDARRKAGVAGNTTTTPAAVAASTSTTTPNTPAHTNITDSTPAPTPARRGRPPSAAKKRELEKQKEKEKEKEKMQPPPKPSVKQEPDTDQDTTMTDAPEPATPSPTPASKPPPPSSSSPLSTSTTTTQLKPSYDPKLDHDPLLRTTDLPKMPSARVMNLLLAEPALSYTAARASISGSGENEKPVRRFCAICGYWGKVKCRKCGEWTCGVMECWKGHEGVCVAVGVF